MAEKEMKNFFLDSFPSVWGFVLPAFGFLEKVENLISELFETEVGGMLSHTAVASREFGIPAIVNVRGATRLIKDGQLVEVDGTQGTVTEL